MNGAQLHLLVNHLPVLGVPFGLLLGAYGLARREEAVTKAALGVLVLAALFAYVSMWSGDGAEHILKRLVAGIDRHSIHEHEEWAERAAYAAYAAGLLALVTLGLSWGKVLRRGLAVATVALALVPAGLLVWSGHLGGEIRHTELSGQAAPDASPVAPLPDLQETD